MVEPNKYLFDLNNFDSGVDFDPEHPPAPTFSEEEVAAARAAGFADGLKKGLADAQAGRDQQIVDLTRKISGDMHILLAAERGRQEQFEQDLISLVQDLYAKTFPILNAEYGLPQITETIKSVLSRIDDVASVVIEVSTEDLDDVSERLKPLIHQHTGQILMMPQSDLVPGSFRMKWKDGGAMRDTAQLAQELTEALAALLPAALKHEQT